eukprot:3891977-Amphidinium_carterae.1
MAPPRSCKSGTTRKESSKGLKNEKTLISKIQKHLACGVLWKTAFGFLDKLGVWMVGMPLQLLDAQTWGGRPKYKTTTEPGNVFNKLLTPPLGLLLVLGVLMMCCFVKTMLEPACGDMHPKVFAPPGDTGAAVGIV